MFCVRTAANIPRKRNNPHIQCPSVSCPNISNPLHIHDSTAKPHNHHYSILLRRSTPRAHHIRYGTRQDNHRHAGKRKKGSIQTISSGRNMLYNGSNGSHPNESTICHGGSDGLLPDQRVRHDDDQQKLEDKHPRLRHRRPSNLPDPLL